MVRHQRIHHRRHRHGREYHGGGAADAVAEVQEADGETAENDGEVEPGEEGALVGEEDFGLDADGKGDSFLGGGVQKGLGRHGGEVGGGGWGGGRCACCGLGCS